MGLCYVGERVVAEPYDDGELTVSNLHVARRGDHKTYEILSHEVNGLTDRLNLMAKEAEVENTYILQEIENKLSNEDTQKWLEYMGDQVDE